jgi:hypothetical protein
MLYGSHMGPTPVIPWGGSPAAGQPPTWLPPLAPMGYWPPPPAAGCWLPPPPAGHSGQSSSTPPPPSGQGYWPPPLWAPLARREAPLWGMPPWMTPTPQPQWPSSSPPTVSHLCLLSIVPFVIWANVECLAYLSIYAFKRSSSLAGDDFTDRVLNMGGSGEGAGGGTCNDAAPWSSCMSCCLLVWRLCGFLCEHYVLLCEDYGFSLICLVVWYMYCCMPYFGGSQNWGYI